MVEAVWDPVTQKVVYVRQEDEADDTGSNKEETTTIVHKKKEKEPLTWRTDGYERNDNNDRRRPRSQGVKPSHPITAQIERMHQDIQQTVITRKTKTARAAHDCQRRAYTDLSTYKSFPLQELAVSYYQELRIEWGVDPDEDFVPPATTTTSPSCGSTTSSSSSASSVATLEPEPKRHISDRNGVQEQSLQYWKEQFLRQRSDPPADAVAAVFVNPLYSLEPRIWGIESATTGKRKYVVAHAGRFFDHYWRQTMPADRHAYELIRPHTPCRLYLDIEYSSGSDDNFLISNAALQVELLYELWLLLQRECEERFRDFRVHGQPLAALNRRDNLIDLESNSRTKFSRHWILHLKTTDDVEVLFPNNLAVGTVVKAFVARLADDPSWREDHPVLSQYLFRSSNGNKNNSNTTCLLDLGVYTRNRIFRLLGSCKFGKAAPLHIAKSNQFDLGIANDCVIRSGDPGAESDVEEQVQESMRRTADWSAHAKALAETLVVPLNSSKISNPLLPIAEEEATTPLPKSVQSSTNCSVSAQQRGRSNYPAIEEYILDRFGDRGGTGGRVRVWSIFEDRILSFHMVDNRWCENIGRQHKSNNIVWNVDLVTHACYQTCHDPDCRGFRGKVYAVPDELFDTSSVKNTVDDVNDYDFFGDEAFEEALASVNIDDVVAEFQSRNGKETGAEDAKSDANDEALLSPEHDSPARPESKGKNLASWLDSDDSDDGDEVGAPHVSDKKNGPAHARPNSFPCENSDDPLELKSHCFERSFKDERPERLETTQEVQRPDLQLAIDMATLTSSHKGGLASWLDSPANENTDDTSNLETGPANATQEAKRLLARTSREVVGGPNMSVQVKSDNLQEGGKLASWLDSPDSESADSSARDETFIMEKIANIALDSGRKRQPSGNNTNDQSALAAEATSSSSGGFASRLVSPDDDTATADNHKATKSSPHGLTAIRRTMSNNDRGCPKR